MKTKQMTGFESDLMEKLRDPEFASAYIMSAIVDNDLNFLAVALGDVAKAHGVSKLAEATGINPSESSKVAVNFLAWQCLRPRKSGIGTQI